METKKFEELQLVELLEDLPEFGLVRGEIGVVVEVLDTPSEAYDLEFVSESGRSSKFAYSIRPTQIRSAEYTAKEFFERGIDLANNGRHAEAVLEFRKAAKIQPTYVRTLHDSIVKSFEGMGEWQRKISVMRLVLSVEPGFQPARDNLAIAFLNHGVEEASEGHLEASLELCHLGLSVGPSTEIVHNLQRNIAAAYTGLGIRAHEEGNFELAHMNMRSACAVDPNEKTRHNLAMACSSWAFWYLDQGKIDEAIEGFERAQDGGLATPRLLNDYAVALYRRGRLDEAALALERAIDIEPDNYNLQQNLTNIRRVISTSTAIGETLIIPYPRETETPPVFLALPAMTDRAYIAA